MNKESLRNELITEVHKLFDKSENKIASSSGIEKLKAMSEHMGKVDNFSKKIIDILNEVLERNNIDFKDEEEKNSFIKYINPTVKELIQKFILNQ